MTEQTQESTPTQETTPEATAETTTAPVETTEAAVDTAIPTQQTQDAAPETTAAQATEAPPEQTTDEQSDTVERVVPAADGYKLPEGIPAEVGQFANANDMTQAQLDSNLQFFGKYMEQQNTATRDALSNLGQAHLKNWGENADYNVSLAKRALATNDPGGNLTKLLGESGYGNHPAVLDFLQTIGHSMKEGGFLKSEVNRPPGKKTAAQTMYGDAHPSNS